MLKNAFFVLDSTNLDAVQTCLYGFTFAEGAVIDNAKALTGRAPEKEGAWVYVHRAGTKLTVTQDSVGCFGLYLYREGTYFALSNSFMLLVDHV